MPDAWLAIPELVSELSEICFAAGWAVDCEYEVWRLMTEGGSWGFLGAERVEAQLRALRAISDQTQLWVSWDEAMPSRHRPVPVEQWKRQYAAWVERGARERADYAATRCGVPLADDGKCGLDAHHDGDHFATFLDAYLAGLRPKPQVRVTAVHVLARYFLNLRFDNGDVRVLDAEGLLRFRGDQYAPLLAHYPLFLRVTVDGEGLRWPTGAALPADLLHQSSKPARPDGKRAR